MSPDPTTRNLLMSAWAMIAIQLVGCGSPPAVTPLLRLADEAIEREVALLDTDRQRWRMQLQQTLDTLEAAYEADLAHVDGLTIEWVTDATRVYAAARDALVRQQVQLDHVHEVRMDNLRAAGRAQRRAIRLIEQQDALLMDRLGLDLWRLDQSLDHLTRETR